MNKQCEFDAIVFCASQGSFFVQFCLTFFFNDFFFFISKLKHPFIILRMTILYTTIIKWDGKGGGGTLNSGVTLNSINSYASRYLCFRLHTEGFCPPTSKFLKCPHNLTFDLVFCLNNNFQMKKIWWLETKLWSKVIFSYVSRDSYAETSVWFVHATDCYYCSGKRNSNKFFLSTKLPLLMG